VAEWQFCKYEWQRWYDHGIRSAWGCIRYFIFSILSNSIFRAPSFHGCPPLRFFTFLGHFYRFYAHLTTPIEDFAFWFRFLQWGARFVISLTWNNTHSWGFRIYIWYHHFAFHLSFEISIFALRLRFQIS